MRRFISSIPFLNAFVPEIKNEGKGIYMYGKNNLLPNELMKFILDSGIAKRCITKTKTYIAATGFIDEKASKMPFSKKQTANDVLTEIAEYCAYFNGFALHIGRDTTGAAAEIKTIPFQCVRRRIDGNLEFNPTYGQPKFDSSQTKVFAPYGGPKITTAQLKEQTDNKEIQTNGEILYCYLQGADQQFYPIPDYYAGIEDIRSSAELSKFDLETIINGFITSAVLTVIGELDDKNKDDRGKSEQDYFNEELGKFTGKIKDENGLSGRAKLLVLNAESKDEVPVLQSFDSKAIMDASIAKRDQIDRVVCRHFGIHPALMGFADATILGNQQAMANASNELNKVVDPIQQMIESGFKQLFPAMDWKISEYTPINYVDAALLPSLTEDEKRSKFLGLQPLEKITTPENQQILNNLNTLSPLLSAEIVKRLPDNELRELIGLKPVPGGDKTPEQRAQEQPIGGGQNATE